MDEIRLHGAAGELKDEIVRLAKRYGIVTPYTRSSSSKMKGADRHRPAGHSSAADACIRHGRRQ